MNKKKNSLPSVYMAGPDVFRGDVADFAHSAKAAAKVLGLNALFPCDNLDFSTIPEHQVSKAIFAGNLALMDQADFMIANTNPWRGLEPDSGTCWEMAYMYAQGKPIIAYRDSALSMVESINEARLLRGLSPMNIDEKGQHWHEGCFVENFSNPLNLMLQQSITELVIGDVVKAFECVAKLHQHLLCGFDGDRTKRTFNSSLKIC